MPHGSPEARKRYRKGRVTRDTIAEDLSDIRLDVGDSAISITGEGPESAEIEPPKRNRHGRIITNGKLRSDWANNPECEKPRYTSKRGGGPVHHRNTMPGADFDEGTDWRARVTHEYNDADRTQPLDALINRSSESPRYR